MRIGFFTYSMTEGVFSSFYSYTRQLVAAMKQLEPGLEVVLLNPYPESKLPWYREWPTYPVPSLRKVPGAATLGNLVLHQVARRLELDILHDPCGIAPFLAPRNGYKRVVTIHDAIPLIAPEVQPLATRLIFRTLVPLSRHTADAVLVPSLDAAQNLERHARLPASKLYVTPMGVHPPEPMEPSTVQAVLDKLGISQPYFLYVGALVPRKNVGRILQAFARLRSEMPQAGLVIAGAAVYKAHAIYQQARAIEGVVFTGHVSEEELHALYYGALALIWPSLYEGFGRPPLEAMAHGTPVITSNVSSLPEVAGDAALLVNPLEVEAIAAAMRRVYEDAELRQMLAERGLERARGFSWEATARKTLEVYRCTLYS